MPDLHPPPHSTLQFSPSPPIPNQLDNGSCQWGMIQVPLISASTPSTALSAQGKDPWRFPLFAHSQERQLAGSEKPFEDWKWNDKRSLIYDKKSISNWKWEQRAVQSELQLL